MKWPFKRIGFPAAAMVMILAFDALAQVPAEPPMSLAACLEEALSGNPGLEASEAVAEAAEFAADAVRAARLPSLGFSSGYAYSDRPQRLVQPSYPGELLRFDNDIFDMTMDVRVPLFAGGRLAARQKAAELSAAGSRFNLLGSRRDLLLNVTTAYLAASRQKSVLEALQAALDALLAQLETAKTLEEVGRAAPLDRLKVQVRTAAVTQSLSKARRDDELIRLHLGVLLGREPGTSTPTVSEMPVLPETEAPEIDRLMEEAVAHRPEIAALRHDVARRLAEAAAIGGERWPSVDAFGRWTARSAVPGGGSPPSHQAFATGGLIVQIPLWTGGELKARAALAAKLLEEAQAREREGILRVSEEVSREAAALAEAKDRETVSLQGLEQAEQAFVIERANYELGRASVNDVLDGQAAVLEAEVAVAQARHDAILARVALTRAAGRDLEAILLEHKDSNR